MSPDQLLLNFPYATPKQLNAAIKYQEKFSLTLENLKCLNPDCSNMRAWKDTRVGFANCCSKECVALTKTTIYNNSRIKAKITYKTKTGYNNPSNNPDIKKRKRENYFKKTGYNHQFQNPEIIKKIKKTCNVKFNSNFYITSLLFDRSLRLKKIRSHIFNFDRWDDKQFWVDNFITASNNFNLYQGVLFFNCTQTHIHNQIKKLGIEYTKLGGTSLKEHAIYPMLDDLNIKYETNTKAIIKPMELDIYLPELGLAIEYNGSYWHSYHETVGTSPKQLDLEYMKYRHQQKSLACIEAGIRLLHIYEYQTEDEVLNNLENFLLYDQTLDTKTNWDLDTGCYPLGISFQVLEPENRIVLKDRVIFGAGKIKLN